MKSLTAQALTPANFAAFGHVIGLGPDAGEMPHRVINGGNALRYDLLPDVQLTAAGGVPMLAIFRAQARQFPWSVTEMERHALGSQSFVPLGVQRFVIVVAPATSRCAADDLCAFVSNGVQGVVLAPGTWHHALLAVEGGDFMVLERYAPTGDCEVVKMAEACTVVL